MMISYHVATQCYNPKDHDLNFLRRENLESHKCRVDLFRVTLMFLYELK